MLIMYCFDVVVQCSLWLMGCKQADQMCIYAVMFLWHNICFKLNILFLVYLKEFDIHLLFIYGVECKRISCGTEIC